MGRSSFVIIPATLKSLRKESNLTQQELICRAYQILGRSPQASAKTLLGHYQRIEKHGHTSRALANAIATVLNTTVDNLQGKETPESYTYVEKIAKQLKTQLALENNITLQHEISKWNDRYNEKDFDSGEVICRFAKELGVQIELTQLFGQESELSRLRELTGWSNEQLLNPANVHGHWFVRETILDYMQTSLEYSLTPVFDRVRNIINKVSHIYTDDMRISIRHEYPWIYFELSCPTKCEIPKSSIIFSRVLPKPDGLKWVSPNLADKWSLSTLNRIAFSGANFVTLKDDDFYPSVVRNLRLKIVEVIDGKPNRVAYTEGWLNCLDERGFNRFLASGNSHQLIVDSLTKGLAEGLCSHLNYIQEIYWEVNAGHGRISLQTSIKDQILRGSYFNLQYKITLVEAMPDGDFRPAPWAQTSIDDAAKSFKAQLQRNWASDMSGADAEKVMLNFEDLVQSDEKLLKQSNI